MPELHKAERLQNIANENDWETQLNTKFDDLNFDIKSVEWNLYCKRGHEALRCTWVGHAFKDALYVYGETKTFPARPGSVQDILVGKPDPKKLKITPTVDDLFAHRHLPWTDVDAPALDIMLSVLDKNLVWIRRIDNEMQNGYVDKSLNWGKPNFKLFYSKSGERQLQWIDRFGFHTVALDRIISVS